MSDRHISVTVHSDGSVTAETHGILGAQCLDYITVLEDLLVAEATSSHFTADYDAASVTGMTPESAQALNRTEE